MSELLDACLKVLETADAMQQQGICSDKHPLIPHLQALAELKTLAAREAAGPTVDRETGWMAYKGFYIFFEFGRFVTQLRNAPHGEGRYIAREPQDAMDAIDAHIDKRGDRES